jgi:DNA-binding transcriptional ArsR family regulator
MEREIPRLKAEFFKTLGHPLRIRVLELLSEGEQTVGALLEQVDAEQPNLSQQLAVLRRAGFVTTRREGAAVVYALADPRIAELLAVARQMLIDMATATRDELQRA